MINICLSKKLIEILDKKGIKQKDYIPAYNGESAGLDLYNCDEDIIIQPMTSSFNNSCLIPTGVKINIPNDYVALIQERGSITKTPLKLRAGVIDSGFTGEIFINCINTSSDSFTLRKETKLPFQIVVVKCDNNFKVVDEEEYINLSNKSRRQQGQVGSSD